MKLYLKKDLPPWDKNASATKSLCTDREPTLSLLRKPTLLLLREPTLLLWRAITIKPTKAPIAVKTHLKDDFNQGLPYSDNRIIIWTGY